MTSDLTPGPKSAAVAPGTDTLNHYPVTFTGTGSEYFKIWIVNIFLTVLTLGIYSAWAKVRNKRYFYGNSILDGSSFEYHARPLQILVGRIVAIVLLALVTFGSMIHPVVFIVTTVFVVLIAPWALWRSTIFNARMSSYRNVRFGFEGTCWKHYLYLFVLPLAPFSLIAAVLLVTGSLMSGFDLEALFASIASGSTAVALGLIGSLLPAVLVIAYVIYYVWLTQSFHSHYIDRHRYGETHFVSKLSTGNYFAIYLQAYIAAIIASIMVCAILGVIGGGIYLMLGDALTILPDDIDALVENEALFSLLTVGMTFVFYFMFALFGVVFAAFHHALMRNYQFGNTTLDRLSLTSELNPVKLTWINVSNLLATIFTLGLFIPWAKVRVARYLAACTTISSPDTLDGFVGDSRDSSTAFGEEVGEAFDFDMGIGI